jgi:hypothetical protein
MERLTRPEIQRFTEAAHPTLRVFEAVLNEVFDEQGARWTDVKLRVGGAMSAIELALNSRLQVRRALWHASMVLMSLEGAVADSHDAAPMINAVAGIAHTLSIVAIACDSEVASEESVRQARIYIARLGDGEVTLERLSDAHEATFPEDAHSRRR